MNINVRKICVKLDPTVRKLFPELVRKRQKSR